MPFKSRCHHHFTDTEDDGHHLQLDGIKIMETGSVFPKWSDCGHFDNPLQILDSVPSNIKVKRNYPQSTVQIYLNSLDFQ